jgi:hypothetical protein
MTPPSTNKSSRGPSLWLRRIIVVLALGLSLTLVFVVHSGLGANTRAATPSFFSNAVAVPLAYKKALGPTVVLVRLVIDPARVSAEVLVDPRHFQRFVLDREVGYVVASVKEALPTDPGSTAFALTAVNFHALPDLVASARTALDLEGDDLPSRVVVDRIEGASDLRWRIYAGPERHVTLTTAVP